LNFANVLVAVSRALATVTIVYAVQEGLDGGGRGGVGERAHPLYDGWHRVLERDRERHRVLTVHNTTTSSF
jgi:hypothetical protein